MHNVKKNIEQMQEWRGAFRRFQMLFARLGPPQLGVEKKGKPTAILAVCARLRTGQKLLYKVKKI
jgi:hypothetical protein